MEMANGLVGAENGSMPGLTSTQGMVDTSSPAQTSEKSERTFTQSVFNERVGKIKREAEEKAARLLHDQPDYAQRKYGDVSFQTNTTPLPNEEHYRKIASEEAQRLRDVWAKEAQSKAEAEAANKIVQNFTNKVLPARDKYSDFDKVTENMQMNRFPLTVQLLADYIDNSGDVLYELAKDRGKIATIEMMCRDYPDIAIQQIQRLAQSVKDNEQASKVRVPNEPLSQMRPSITGTDTGVMSVKDLRRKYRV